MCRSAEQHPREKTWLTMVVVHKMSNRSGEEKEAVAQKKDGARVSVSEATAPPAHHFMSVDRDAGLGRAPSRLRGLLRTSAHPWNAQLNEDDAMFKMRIVP